jgi:hypothetical protein
MSEPTPLNIAPLESPANLHLGDTVCSPEDEFRSIDAYVRDYDRQWVTVAQLCLRVKQGELWKHGGHHSWEDWINQAAPKSARTIFYYVGLVRDLPEFTTEELQAMRPETAKAMRKLSPSVRRDKRVREAASLSKRSFIEVVKELHADQHLELDSIFGITLSETQRSVVEEEFAAWRVDDPDISDGEILVALCIAASEIRKREQSNAAEIAEKGGAN